MASIKTDIHVGDVGTIFRVTITDNSVAVDLHEATVKNILFRKPNGTVLTKTAEFTTDGADGVIEYEAEVGFLSVAGVWEIGAIVETPEGRWTATSESFKVRGEFD